MNVIRGVYVENIAVCSDKGSRNLILDSIGVVRRVNIVFLNVLVGIGVVAISRITHCTDNGPYNSICFRVSSLASPPCILAIIGGISISIIVVKSLQVIIWTTGYLGLGIVFIGRTAY